MFLKSRQNGPLSIFKFKMKFCHSKCKYSKLRSQRWIRLFLWFSNTVVLQYNLRQSSWKRPIDWLQSYNSLHIHKLHRQWNWIEPKTPKVLTEKWRWLPTWSIDCHKVQWRDWVYRKLRSIPDRIDYQNAIPRGSHRQIGWCFVMYSSLHCQFDFETLV